MERTYKIGELAGAVGITVRTLHHYDRIGLLKPSGHTENGHRLYSQADLARLQQGHDPALPGIPARPHQGVARTA